MGAPLHGSFHAEVLRGRGLGQQLNWAPGAPAPTPTASPLVLTARVRYREGLWLSIGVGGKGALWIWPLRVAPLRVRALGVAPLRVRALRVATLGVGAGALGVPWLAIRRRLKGGLWVRGSRVGRHGGLGSPRISRVGGRIAVPRHQETLFMGHGLRFCGLPLEEREKEVSPAVTSPRKQPPLPRPTCCREPGHKGGHS